MSPFNWFIDLNINLLTFFFFAEPEPLFPYQNVTLKTNVDPSSKYDILPELGRGSFGTVFLCKEKKTGLELAAKIVKYKKKKERADMEREIDIMSSLHHPRLIQMYDAFDYDNHIYVVLELYVTFSRYFDKIFFKKIKFQ